MALIHEETEHESGVSLMVSERQEGETRSPWKIITLDADRFENLTPTELRKLGKWLMHQGRRIGSEYKSNGALKAKSHNAKIQP